MPDFHIPNDPEWQWAYDLILFGVGEEFPKADPTALRAMGEDLYKFSSHLLNGLGGTANLGNSLGSHLNGPAADAFSGFQGDITRSVPDGAQVALQLGHAAYQFALDSENTQYNIVIAAFTQVVEIAIALASGFGAAAVPALVKIGQEIVRTLINFLRLRLQNQLLHLVWEGVQEGLEEVWQSAAADLMQIAEGNRKEINYQNLLMAFAGGFFIGLGVSGTHWIAGKAYPKINKDVYSRETLSAFSETLFEGLFTMMVGGGGFNPFATFTSSIIGGMAHHYAEVFGKQFGPKVGPNDLRPPPTLDSHDRDPNASPQPPAQGPPVPVDEKGPNPQNSDTPSPTPIAPPPVAPTPPPAPPPVAPVPTAPDPGGPASTEAPAGADGPAPAPGVVAGNPMPATTGPVPADATAPRPAASDPPATDAVATPSDAPPSPVPVAGTPPGTPITPAGSPPADTATPTPGTATPGTATPTPGTAGLPGATPQAPPAASGVDATADPGQTGSGTPALPGTSTPPTAPAGPAETGVPDAPGGVPVGAGSPAPTGGVVTPPAATGASASGGDAAQTASPGAPAPTNPVDTPAGVPAAPPPMSGTAPNSPPTAAPPDTTAGPPADGTTRPAEGTTATPSSSGTPPITPPVAAGTPDSTDGPDNTGVSPVRPAPGTGTAPAVLHPPAAGGLPGLAPPSPAANAQVPAPVPPASATPATGINGNTPTNNTASPTTPPTNNTASPTTPPTNNTASPTTPPTNNTASPTTPTQSGDPARPAEAPRPAPPTAVSVDGLSPIEGPTAPAAVPSQPRADQSVTAPAEPPGWTGGPTSTSDPGAGVDAEDTWTRDPIWDSDADADSETGSIWDDDPGRETDATWDDDSDGVAPADRPAAGPTPAQSAPEPARAPVGAAPIGPREPATHGEDRLRHEPGSPVGSSPTTVAAPTAAVVSAAELSTDAVNVEAETRVTAELDQPGHRPPSAPSGAAATTVADTGVAGAGTRGPADPVRGTHIAPPAGTRVPAGLVLLDPDQTDNWTAAHDHPTRADHYVVFAHGTPDGVVVDGKLVTPEQLAALITGDPRSHGKHIVLAVCDIATGDYDLRLSDQPGITAVSAPELTAWTTPDGRILSAAISHTPAGHPRPDLTRPGTWRHSGKHPPASRITRNPVLPTPDPLTGSATSSPPAPRQHQTVGEVPGHSSPGGYVAWTLRREPALPTIPEVEEIELDELPPAADPVATAPASAADTATVVNVEENDHNPPAGTTTEPHPDDNHQNPPADTDQIDSTSAVVVATVPPTARTGDNPLRGLYRDRPDLLNEPDSVDDLDSLVSGLDQSIHHAVRRRAAESSWIAAMLSHLSVDTKPVQRALRDELRSFFTTGGRSFFLRDGLHRWHRVTVRPRWNPADAQVIDQSEDKAKFDTRSDWSDGSKQASSVGSSGAISAGTMIPQRVGLGGGFSVDVSLSRPSETFQDSVKLTDSHNVRSGSGSHLVSVPADFEVVVTDPYESLTGPRPATRTMGDPVRVGLTLRGVDDIANAQPRQVTVPVDPARHTSVLVENFTPARILSAGIDLPSGVPPTDSWNDVAEDALVRLQPTKTVPPGSVGADQGRRMLEETSMVGNLIPALESAGHPSTITSQHGNHALSVKITAAVTELSVTADIAKSSFRWQPGEVGSTKLAQMSRVGLGVSAIPARWSFGPAYVQGRLFGGFLRSMITSVSRGGASRIGTEFKDIPNVLVEARVRVTIDAGVREVPLQRLPFGERGTVEPIRLDMVVLGRLPASRLAQLLHDASPFAPSPTQWHAPPYALTDARAVTYGLSAFNQLYLDVTGLVRRFPGGFLPRYGETDKVSWMGSSRAATERQTNQNELDRVLTVPGLRQGRKSLLGGGLVAQLSRTKPFGTPRLVVHVTGRYTSPLDHKGTSRNDAVRTTDIDSSEQKLSADGQWRTAVAVEGGGIFRLVGSVGGTALVPAGAFEYRHRVGRQSSTQLAGNESRLIGGTPDSEAFGTDLEITATVYAYAHRPGFDSRSRIGFARVLRPRLPRPVAGETDATSVVRTTREQVTAAGGRQFTRFRLTQARPVTVQLDAASVVATPLSLPVTLTPAPDPLGVARRTRLEQSALREWVDAEPTVDVDDWLAIEGLPGSTFVAKLAAHALGAAQQYGSAPSRTHLRGVRGIDGLIEGMPVWATLLDRIGQFRQGHGLSSMLNGVWLVDRLTNADDGAATDIAIAAALTKARLVPTAHVPVFSETASTGSAEVGASSRVEDQFAFRSLFSATLRRLGADTGGTSSGGVLGTAGHEKLLYAGGKQNSESVSGAIERNVNNRAGRNRTFVVSFDLRASASVEVTTDPARYRIVPRALRSGGWLHHHKSVQRHGTITNAVALRLSAPAVVGLGLLRPLAGDVGTMGAPWMPQSPPELRLLPGHGPGLGLYTIHQAPNLTGRLTAALEAEAARTDDGRSTARKILDAIRSRGSDSAAAKISASISDPGIDDTMLNRRRLVDLFSRDGVRQHWPALVDGGLSVMHVKAARTSQHPREVRLVAETTGTPVFMGFVADHNDLDIKTTYAHGSAETRHRRHGHLFTAGVAGTGVSNHHGENIATGAGDTVGRAIQEQNARSISTSTVQSDLSSARGVKVRMALPVRFSLVVFDRGSQVASDLLTVEDRIVQDRWADDVRLPRTAPAARPTTYRIHAPGTPAPGWRTLNGLPLPPRFSAEDLGRVAQLQDTVERLLSGTARRLRLPGYAGAHQVHQSLTPEILLPAVSAMLTPDGFELPPVTSAQIFGQRAQIVVRLVPEAASLRGVSSKVYREHAVQDAGEYSSGTSALVQDLRGPRVPLLGRGNVDDPYQPLESGGTGAVAGDSQAATESGSSTTGGFGNVKPESRSALVDYLSRVEVDVALSYSAFPSSTVTSVGQPTELLTVSLRMGLHDARTALDIPADGTPRPEAAERVAAFAELAAREAELAKAADAFVSAADRLDQARFDAYAAPEGSTARATYEAVLPGLGDAWDQAGQDWWHLAQRHYQLVDDFSSRFLGVAPAVDTEGAQRLADHVHHLDDSRIEDVPDSADDPADDTPPTAPTDTPPTTSAEPTEPVTEQQPAPQPPTPPQPPEAEPSHHTDNTAASTTKDATAPTPPAGSPEVDPPSRDVLRTPAGPRPGLQTVSTPGDGRCQLYSIVGSAPQLVGSRLVAAGLDTPVLRSWLANPDAVRAQLDGLTGPDAPRDPDGLVPQSAELGQAAERLRQLVERYVQSVGRDGIPGTAIQAYRFNRNLRVRAEVDTLNRKALLDRLRSAGVTSLRNPDLVPATTLRDRYVEQRTADLVASGQDADSARTHAEQEVPLKPSADGPPRDLHDDSLSMRAMFDYLTAHGVTIPVESLQDAVLRDQLADHLIDPARPVTVVEFAALTDAVRNWEKRWRNDIGESFVGLLAAALDARIRIHAPGHVHTLGRDDAPLIDVQRQGDHYQAVTVQDVGGEVDTSRPAPVDVRPTDVDATTTAPADLDHDYGPAVLPKKVKPFELDPPRDRDQKGVKGDDLRTQQVRLNPALMPLADFTEFIWAGRPDAHWHYVVAEDGQIWIGSEELLTAVSDRQLDDLHRAMREKDPELTLRQLRDLINEQGHPTIGARFTTDGRTLAGPARISGELHRDPTTGAWTVNDKSGRYMSGKVRKDINPTDVQRWLENVAGRISAQTDEPVTPTPYKHAEPPPPQAQTEPARTDPAPAPPPPTAGPVPAGLTLLDETETHHREAAARVPARPGQFLVFAHGGRDGLRVRGEPITASQLAAVIAADPRAQGKEIVLISCDTGGDITGPAAELAAQDGVASVLAPAATAFVTPTGRIFTASPTHSPDGHPRPDLTRPGTWHRHTDHPPASEPVHHHELPSPDTTDQPLVPEGTVAFPAPFAPTAPSTGTGPRTSGPPPQDPAHVPEPDYQLLRSADPDHLAALHARVRRLVAARVDDRSRLPLEAYREIADAMTTAIGAPPVRRMNNDPQRRGAFDRQSWEVFLRADLPVDQVMTSLVHELTHLEQMTVIAQLLATTAGDAAAAGQVTPRPEVQTELWESRSPDDPRYPAMRRIWNSVAANDMQVSEDQSLRVLRNSADARVSAARGMYQFSARVMQRLSRSNQALLDARFEMTHPKYTALPMEMQAYLTQLRYESLGSVMDWSGTPVTRLVPPPGYQLDGLGPAGIHLRPAGAPGTRPDRLPHPDRPMLVISIADRSEAQRILQHLRAELPPRVLVELVLASPITAGQGVHLAGLLGPDQVLAAAPALVTDTEGGHVDHLVPHSRLHTATAPAFAHYLTIHPTPQAPTLLTPVHDMPYLGNGRWDVYQGWELVSIGHRVWIGPPGATPVIADDDPRVVIGVPTQDTPWSAWQFGMWVSRTLATQEGAVDTGITRVHRPELQPPQLQLTGDLVHAVSPQDVQLARTVTGLPDPMAAYGYSHPHPFPPLDVVPGHDLTFTPYHLIDALLDVAAPPVTERDPASATAALTELAGQLGHTGPTALRNLLAAGFLAARAYGIGTFGPSRLAAAHRALRLLEPTGDLTAGPGAAADLVAWVAGMNIDQNAPDLPVRLMRILDRTRTPGVGLGDLNIAEQRDDERIRLALDALRHRDAGVWVTSGVDPQIPLAPVDGAIVLAYLAGPALEPSPPGHPPTTDTDPMAVPLALLADQARHRISPPPGPTIDVHLTPVTDHPITAADFYWISGDLGDLDDRLGWNVILRKPVRPDGTEAQLVDVDENAGPPEVHEAATASAGDVTGT
ncbi:hypothetical protein ACFFKH_10045 [Micromonospora marina]|uniref:hypothetical protein n=1 Tax=Micromonospora marina TaxID=307120 RepID=UPI0035F020AF